MSVAAYERFQVPSGAIEHVWRRDIDTGVAAMTTTGGHLWNAAERLAGVTTGHQHNTSATDTACC